MPFTCMHIIFIDAHYIIPYHFICNKDIKEKFLSGFSIIESLVSSDQKVFFHFINSMNLNTDISLFSKKNRKLNRLYNSISINVRWSKYLILPYDMLE